MTTDPVVESVLHELRRHKQLGDDALNALDDSAFFDSPHPHVNSVALIVKHLSGNLRSRWTDFRTTDGEKPDRMRDTEFELHSDDTRQQLMQRWEEGWTTILDAAASITTEDLAETVTIRGEPHSVLQALIRGLTHAAYHTGQILYLARRHNTSAKWLTIAPGASSQCRPGYLS